MHKLADPPSKTTYHLRGGLEYHLPPKKSLSPISFLKIADFFMFIMSSSKGDSGKKETYFTKPREVFFQHGLKKEKFFPILHRFHHLGESKPSLSPIFFIFHFFVTVLILWGLFQRDGGEFGKTKRGFCS
jgi:hypothetical protein